MEHRQLAFPVDVPLFQAGEDVVDVPGGPGQLVVMERRRLGFEQEVFGDELGAATEGATDDFAAPVGTWGAVPPTALQSRLWSVLDTWQTPVKGGELGSAFSLSQPWRCELPEGMVVERGQASGLGDGSGASASATASSNPIVHPLVHVAAKAASPSAARVTARSRS